MRIDIPMPKAGLTMVEGTISEWKVPEGALIQKGEAIMEYENEKNTIEYESVHGGYLHILEPAGETVEVGRPIAWVAETREEYDALVGGAPAAAPAGQAAPAAESAPAAEPESTPASPAPAPRGQRRVRATGLARKMAREAGVDLAEVPPGSGPDGRRIAAKDVTAYLESRKAAPAAAPAPAAEADEVTAIPWTGVRKTIARNMMTSLQQSAQCTAMCEVDVTDLLALRKKLVEGEEYLGCRVTVNDLLCMAVCKVLKKHPTVNATFDGQTLYSHKHVQLSLAVATEGGLMVPVIKNTDTLTLTELSAAARDLGRRAREKRLQNGEQGCGTCTVSNVGMFPIDLSTPILNPPEVGIFGFGRTTRRPGYLPDGTLAPRDMMWVYLTFDHRVVDGLEAGKVFQDLQYLLEHPQLITA